MGQSNRSMGVFIRRSFFMHGLFGRPFFKIEGSADLERSLNVNGLKFENERSKDT